MANLQEEVQYIMSYGDDFDPYAPPQTDVTASKKTGNFGSAANFTLSDVLSRSWQIMRSRMGLTIAMVVVYFVLANLMNAIAGSINNQVVKLLLTLANLVLSVFFQVGLFTYLLNLASGREAGFKDLFSGGPLILPVFFASLVFGLVIFGALIPAGILAIVLPPIGIIVALVYGVIAYIYIFTRLSQFYYLLIDREVGIIESLKLSSQLMKGREIQFLGLTLMLGLLNFAGALAFLVGLLITVPLSLLCLAVYYLGITGQPVADPLAIE